MTGCWRRCHRILCWVSLFMVFIFTSDRNAALMVSAISTQFQKTSKGTYGVSVVSSFGMARGGVLSVDYNVQSDYTLNAMNSYVLLVLVTSEEAGAWFSGLSDSSAGGFCFQPSLFRQQIYGQGTTSFEIPATSKPSQFSAIILQCRSPQKGHSISVSATVNMQNKLPYSSELTHLPIQNVMIMRVLEGELIVYSLFFGALIYQLIFSRQWMRTIHGYFAASLCSQLFTLTAQYADYSNFQKVGIEPDSYKYFTNISDHINSVVVLATILFLSLGWSTVRPIISPREVRLALASISVYFLAGLFAASCLDQTQDLCDSLALITYVLRTIVFLGIIIAMNFTVSHLKATLMHSTWAANLPIHYIYTRRYQLFRVAFIVYLLAPTAILLIQGALFSWEQDWVVFTLNEMIVLLMFFHVGVNFSPIHEHLASRAFDGNLFWHISAAVVRTLNRPKYKIEHYVLQRQAQSLYNTTAQQQYK